VAGNIRHQLSDRVFHWAMAVLTIILLGTAFLPILGIKFDWLPIHWIAGVLLILSVIFHLYRSFFVHGLTEMLPRWRDIKSLTGKVSSEEAKYDLGQQLYHWSIAVIMLALLITGGCMLAKIDTPFWNRDPSIFSDWTWGIIYVLHGAASCFLIFFFILHVYFSFLPEHRDLLRSMIQGKRNFDN
jgi:cytochrome b subunit of formate dehydrogenase